MKRILLRSSAFIKASKKIVKRYPQEVDNIYSTMVLLANDAYDTRLKTHKLKGTLSDSWACSVSYELRIVFKFVEVERFSLALCKTTIFLLSIKYQQN